MLLLVISLGVRPESPPQLLRHALPGYPPTRVAYIAYQQHWSTTRQTRALRVGTARSALNNNNNKAMTMTKLSSSGSQVRPATAVPPTTTQELLW
jgi:hypothetical protein